jgi:endonuclease/exonuclease/phosphatase family metal-dependent hydrolase
MQAQELVARFSFAPFPVILLGDFNSMPEDTIDPNSGAVPPYTQLVGSGFVDLWLERIGRRDPRYTCCQAEDLRNRASMLDMRIDHIFVRNPDGDQTFARPWHIRSWTVGDKRNDKTVSGLWPSDHAGVIAVIQPRHDSARRGKRNLVASHHRFRCGNEPAERASCEHP